MPKHTLIMITKFIQFIKRNVKIEMGYAPSETTWK